MNRKQLSFRDIEANAAKFLSSFDGSNVSNADLGFDGAGNKNDYYGYDGSGDPDLDFGGGNITFANEMAGDRQYQFTISNLSNTEQSVIICPSYKPSNAALVIRDGAIPYSVGATDLTASGNPAAIAEFLVFVQNNPTRVVQFQIESNNSTTLSKTMTTQHKVPWAIMPINQINLSNYRTEFASNDKLATIKKQLQFDDQTEIILKVPARVDSTTPTLVTVTLFIGGVNNKAKSLHKKFNTALQNPAVRNNLVMMGSKALTNGSAV